MTAVRTQLSKSIPTILTYGPALLAVGWYASYKYLRFDQTHCPNWRATGIVVGVQIFLALISLGCATLVGIRYHRPRSWAITVYVVETVLFGFLALWEFVVFANACEINF